MIVFIKKKLNIILIFIFVLSQISAFSQKEWTLEACINYAFTNNLQIKQSKLTTDISAATLKQSKASVLPDINANMSHTYNFGKTIDPFTNDFATNQVQSNSFSISSNLILFQGLRTLNTIKKNEQELILNQKNLEVYKNQIALAIASGYLQILFNQELLSTGKKQLETTQEKRNRTEKFVEAGVLSKGALLEIESQLSSEELQLVTYENQLELSYLNLIQLMDYNEADSLIIEKPYIKDPTKGFTLQDAALIFETALKTMPEIQAGKAQVKSSEYGLKIAQSGRSPQLMVRGSLGTGYSGASRVLDGYEVNPNPQIIGMTSALDTVYSIGLDPIYKTQTFQEQLDANINQTIGFYLSIPLFNKYQVQTSISQSKIALEQSKLQLESAKNDLRKTIQQAYADAKAALKQYYATQKALDAFNENFKFINEKYDQGMATSVEYNEAWNNLKKAESDLLRSKYDYIFKIKILDFYLGKPLTLK